MTTKLKKLLKRTPIAWLQTTNNPVKMLIALAGISFSNLLIFFQLGLMDSLYNSQRKPIERMQADLIMVSSKYSNLGALQELQRSRLYQILGVEGVEYVSPLRIARGTWINPQSRESYDIYVFGVNLIYPSLAFPELEQDPNRLQPLRTALYDRNSKKQYGDVSGTLASEGQFFTEVSGKEIKVISTFEMGSTFAAEANLITNDSTFLYLFPKMARDKIQIGLIKLQPGTSVQEAKANMQSVLTKDVMVLTKEELSQLEVKFWKKNSSVGFIFTIGVLVGFLVGSIIVYQILYGDVMNSLPQYATLKAMGYTDKFVILLVIQQSAILALIGFVPGIITSYGLYYLLANVTKLTIYMTLERAIQVLILTFVMCVGSGTLATRKLVQLDPADVF